MFPNATKIKTVENVCLISFNQIPGDLKLAAEIFERFAVEEIIIDMISQTPSTGKLVDISFTCFEKDMVKIFKITKSINKLFSGIKPLVSTGNTKIQIENAGMNDYYGFFSRAISALSAENVEIKQITTSEVDISILVDSISQEGAVNILKNIF